MMNKKHNNTCKRIVEELKKYASGNYYIYEGELIDPETSYLDKDGLYYFDIDGEKVEETDLDTASLFDYFTDYLDIDYILDSNKELKAVRVMVAFGGPNIYINTYDKKVELFWWNEAGEAYIPYEICNEINDFFAELWNC